MKKLHALVLGATGSTGQELVKFLLDNPHFHKVSVFVRKTMNMKLFDVTYTAGRRKKTEDGFEAKKAKEVLLWHMN